MPSPRKAKRPTAIRGTRISDDLRRARRVLAIEASAIIALADRLDERFGRAVQVLSDCRGKVVVMGMGKSGIIGRKLSATLTSTGTPAVFLHAAEAAHGDAGVFVKGDTVVVLSSSGESDEVVRLLPLIKRLQVPLIAMTGNLTSTLARAADVVLDVGVAEEACPMGLAPTASTTAALALGDALAVALLERKGFGPNDFAVLHPAGALGRRFLKVEDLMHKGAEVPLVKVGAPFDHTLLEITGKRMGVTGVVSGKGELVGIITDGDLRRALERRKDIRSSCAADLMTRNPKTVGAEALAEQALAEMERFGITSLFIVADGLRKPIGVIHLHDLLRARVV
jgi:arabinose-5-phosphate isomerase